MTTSLSPLQKRDLSTVWHPFTQAALDGPPLVITHAKESCIYSEEGVAYIDAISSWWAVLHGHSHPHITQAIAKQLECVHHVIFSAFTHEPAIALAERLIQKLPASQERVFFSDNGSTAVEIALKMAIQFWSNTGSPKKNIIAFENAYHGDTFGAMSLSESDAFTKPFQPYLFPIKRIPTPVPGKEDYAVEKLKEFLAKGDVAAFVFEPLIAGATGMHMYSEAVLDELVYQCKKHDVLTIADEVMTGFGRTGHDFVSNALTNTPDLLCFSKGLTGGTLALGATTTTDEIYQAFSGQSRYQALLHGHTFTGNPIACASGLASMDLFEKPECEADRLRIEQSHNRFAEKLKGLDGAQNVRTKGVVFAFEIASSESDGYASSMRDRLLEFFLAEHVHLRPLGNTVYILPPYCITDGELRRVYEVIEEAVLRFGSNSSSSS